MNNHCPNILDLLVLTQKLSYGLYLQINLIILKYSINKIHY